jgi:hypothetical protein
MMSDDLGNDLTPYAVPLPTLETYQSNGHETSIWRKLTTSIETCEGGEKEQSVEPSRPVRRMSV